MTAVQLMKEYLWYVQPGRYSAIAQEIEEAVQSYAISKNQSSKKKKDRLRAAAQQLCAHHLVHSGIREEQNVCINIDAEFCSEGTVNQENLNRFIKEIVKAYCYQKVLWEYMGTTSSFTCISKLAMEQDGFVYEDYLPVSYKRDAAQKAAEKIKRENKVPIYAYTDGTVSEHYDKKKARFSFNALKDTSGFNWTKGYDPNDTVEKKGWHGAYNKDGYWVKVNESEHTEEIGSIRQPVVQPLQLIKEKEGALLYDGSGFFSETSDILYIDALLHVYAHSQNDKTATVERIKQALQDLGVHTISHVACPGVGKKETLERYRKALGKLARDDLRIIEVKEAEHKIQSYKAQQALAQAQHKGILLEKSIQAAAQSGMSAAAIRTIDIEKGIPTALNRTDTEDLKTLLSKPADIEYIQTLPVADEQEALFNRILLHLLYLKKHSASDIPVPQLAQSICDSLQGKKTSVQMGYQTSFYTLCSAEDELEKRIKNTKTEYDISASSQRERFLQELVHKKYIAQDNVATIEQELSSLYESIPEEQKEKTNRSIQNALYAYKDIATSTGMSIKEIIQKAAQQQNATDDMIIYREVPLQTLIKYASTQKPLSKTTKIAQLNEKTIMPIVIGGQQGSSVATLLYEHTGQTLPAEIIAVLQTIRLTDTVNGRQKQHIQELVQHTFKKSKGHVQEFAKDLYCALDIRDDVSYNLADKEGLRAYEQSERFRKSGLTKTQLSALIQKAIQNIPAQNIPAQEYEKTIQPVYTVKENSIFSTIHTTGIPPQVYPIAQKVYEAHKKSGTFDALMASYTGTKVTDAATKAEHAAFMQVTQDATQSAHGSTTGNSKDSSTTATSQAPADGKSTQRTEARSPAEHSPALSAADKEKLRMARINANYEHDKKLLAKEDPAFVRSPFHNIGHAQGNEDDMDRNLYNRLLNKKAEDTASHIEQKADRGIF